MKTKTTNKLTATLLSLVALSTLGLGAPALADTVQLETCHDKKDQPLIYRLPDSDWMFHRDELKERRPIFNSETKEAMRDLVRTFRRQGTEIVMIALPPRIATPRTVQDQSVDGEGQSVSIKEIQKKFKQAQKELSQTGFHVLDLAELAWAEGGRFDAFYYKQDHHWLPGTRDVVAQQLAARVSEEGISLPPLDNLEYVKGEAFKLTRKGTRAEKSKKNCTFEIIDESQTDYQVTVRAKDLVQGLFGDLGGDLGGGLGGDEDSADTEMANPVLVGTSNSDAFEAALHFSLALNSEVEDWSITGGGAYSAMESYLLNRDREAPVPSLIIWEISADSEYNLGRSSPQLLGAQRNGCKKGWHFFDKVSLFDGEWLDIRMDGRPVDLFAFRVANPELTRLDVLLYGGDESARYRLNRLEKRLVNERKGKPLFLSTEHSVVTAPTRLRLNAVGEDTDVMVYACAQ